MSNFRVGTKVTVPRLCWRNGEIIEVSRDYPQESKDGELKSQRAFKDFREPIYLVKNLDADGTEWCISNDMMVKA